MDNGEEEFEQLVENRRKLLPKVVNSISPRGDASISYINDLDWFDQLGRRYRIEIPCIIPLYMPPYDPEPRSRRTPTLDRLQCNFYENYEIGSHIIESSNTDLYKLMHIVYTKYMEELVVLYNDITPFKNPPLPIMPDTYLELNGEISERFNNFNYYDSHDFIELCEDLEKHISELKKYNN
jgi:hypothetical protein